MSDSSKAVSSSESSQWDPSCRNTWLLALGAGVNKGMTEKPIRHIDVAATAAAILNVPAPGIAGTPAKEILV